MSFPIDLNQLRVMVEKIYFKGGDDIKDAPSNFRPLDDILHWLTVKEKSFVVKDDKLYLNWGELRLVDVFDSALDAIRHGGPTDENISTVHCVSGVFRMEGPTIGSLGAYTPHEDWAASCLLQALDKTVGYDTACGYYLIGFTLADLEESYTAYNRDIGELPDFSAELRMFIGDEYDEAIKHMHSLKPNPVAHRETSEPSPVISDNEGRLSPLPANLSAEQVTELESLYGEDACLDSDFANACLVYDDCDQYKENQAIFKRAKARLANSE